MKLTNDFIYVGTHTPTPITSRITNRQIHVNNSSLFVVPATFSRQGVEAARDQWETHKVKLLDERQKNGKYRYRSNAAASAGFLKGNQLLIDRCFVSRTHDEFMVAVENLVRRLAAVEKKAADSPQKEYKTGKNAGKLRGKIGRRSGETRRLIEAMLIMWRHDLLLFPMSELWTANLIITNAVRGVPASFYGPVGSSFDTMRNAVRWSSQTRAFKLLPVMIGNLVEVGDIDAQVMTIIQPFVTTHYGPPVTALCDQILAEQIRIYGVVPSIPQSYRHIFARQLRVRSDREFLWAIEQGGDRLREWASSIANYLDLQTNRIALRSEVVHLNLLLDYVISDESIPSRPVDFCRRSFEPRKSLLDFISETSQSSLNYVSQVLRLAMRYFDAVLKSGACNADGEVSRGFCNPIDEESIPRQLMPKGKTHRNSIPLRYMRHIKEIIEGPYVDGKPTFAWPKTLKSDYFTWVDPTTSSRQQVWSPVRANFFLTRFAIPIRELQTRLLDSGEADFEEYRPSQGGWVRNVGQLAPTKADEKHPTGLIRRIWDAETGRWFNGLYITTNKTADRVDMFMNNGYEIPWENTEIIEIFCRMRDWQEKYNPCPRLLSRSELLSDRTMIVSADLADRVDKLCFLFRDAADIRYPQEPMTEGRAMWFWRVLIDELEKRLEENHQTNRDGSKIKLVMSRKETGLPLSVIFDMHTLRVTGLTALIAAGVPIHILSEFVAGHATILMTLYYYKPGAGKVTEVLDKATKWLSEQDDWEAFLSSYSPELIHDIFVYNSPEGEQAAAKTQSALWSILDEGTCPNGGALCQIGGPVIGKHKKHGPVPGGNRNCVSCRFFVSGPKYLAGLVAKFIANAGIIREKCLRLKDAEAQRREVVAAIASAGETSRVMHDRILMADEAIETIGSELDTLSQTWVAQEKLITRNKNIIDEFIRANAECKDAIVLNGEITDFEISLKECSEFDLWDRICRSADVYPSIDSSLPSIRRARLLDVMLTKNAKTTVFATLSDQQLQYVGNAWTAHLRALMGDANLSDLVEGQVSLRELGMDAEIDALVKSSIEQPRRFSPIPSELASKSEGAN